MNRFLLVSRQLFSFPARGLARLHRDQQGSISIASVFALLLLVFILGMVMNSSRQVDQKVKMQNAADAATYSAGVVISRNMNTVAYTNHLLCDVFALTAFMREARDRNSESMTPEILEHWQAIAPAFAGSEFPKFAHLGLAIAEKLPHEREMIYTFSEWAAAASEMMLPVLEEILETRAIPEFQRALTNTTPELAQYACDAIARRHGQQWPTSAVLRGVLWRTNGDPAGGISEVQRRTLPVADPMEEGPYKNDYVKQARRQRNHLAYKYLREWNAASLKVFDDHGKMSQFSNLWRVFSRGYLKKLLDSEYRYDNLLFQIRTPVERIDNLNRHLEEDFMFVGVVYREKTADVIPGIFQNPVASDMQAYSQMMLYVPKRRLEKRPYRPRSSSSSGSDSPSTVSIPGDERDLPLPPQPVIPDGPPPPDDSGRYYVTRQFFARYPDLDGGGRIPGTHWVRWDLVNQNWSMQIVPATARRLPEILSARPYVNGVTGVETPQMQSLSNYDMQWLSHH